MYYFRPHNFAGMHFLDS
uniref:Uncharacterized protein n=1 Tax=Arundo donax TaxID=35708 RepID=A0A0A9C0G0_ARUDO